MYQRIDRFFGILAGPELYLFVISVSLAASLTVALLYYSCQSFDLVDFYHRAIGGAVMDAQDSAKRNEVFYSLLVLVSIAFATMFSVSTALIHLLARRNLLFKTGVERTVITHSALLILPCLIMKALHVEYSVSIKILTGIAFASLLLLSSKICFSFSHRRLALGALCRYQLLLSLLFIYSSCYFGLTTLLGYEPVLVGVHSLVLVFVAVLTIYVTEATGRHINTKRLVQAALPLLLVPLALPVSCEIQYWLTKYQIVEQNTVYAAMLLPLVFCSVYLYRKDSVRFSPQKTIRSFFFPVLLITLIVFAHWQAEFTFTLGDLLHPGNFLVPSQLFVRHGLLPFIEFWPDLGLQSTLPASLYGLIFGSQGLDELTYHFLPRLLGGVALYFILCRFFSAQWALLCAAFLPLAISPDWIASGHRFYFPDRVSFALISILCVGWVMRSFSTNRLIMLWLIALLSFAWMPSTGKTVVQSLFVLLALRALQEPMKSVGAILVSFVTVFVPAFTLYCLLLYLNGFNPIESIQLVLSYNLAENYVLSHPTIVRGEISALALWYYGITPLLLLATSGIVLYRQLRGRYISPEQWILVALALFTLFAGLRSLHRHCLIEAYIPVFFIILAALFPFLFIRHRQWGIVWATIIFTVSALFIPRNSGLLLALHTTPVQWSSPRPTRVIANDPKRVLAIADFFKQHLTENQTYLEFIHAHLLYVLSGHAIPPFHKITRILSSERPQQLYLKHVREYYQQDKIPFVILDGAYWGSKVDNIASAMAVFRISEFIYTHYSPFAEVNGFTILKADNSDITFAPPAELVITSIRFEKGQYFQTTNAGYSVKDGLLTVTTGSPPSQIDHMLAYAKHPVILNKKRSYFLRFNMRSNTVGRMRTYFSLHDEEYSKNIYSDIMLEPSREMKDVLIPIPMGRSDIMLTDLRFDLPDNAKIFIESIDLIEPVTPDIAPKQISSIAQTYVMKKLPYIWANFDKDDRWQSGGVLFSDHTERFLLPRQQEVFFIPAEIDKTSGNYLSFRIQSRQGGEVKLTYGNTPQSSLSFDIIASEQPENYVIRISSQWSWMKEGITKITLSCDNKTVIQSFSIWKAD